jgi:hypothetical protein
MSSIRENMEHQRFVVNQHFKEIDASSPASTKMDNSAQRPNPYTQVPSVFGEWMASSRECLSGPGLLINETEFSIAPHDFWSPVPWPPRACLGRPSSTISQSCTHSTEEKKVASEPKAGQKFDGSKRRVIQGFINYFPRAIEAVTEVSEYGTVKYNAGKFPTTWKEVVDGIVRYTDALGRHLLEEAKGNVNCPESGLMHAKQTAWNAMARLELILIEEEKKTLKENQLCQTPQTN